MNITNMLRTFLMCLFATSLFSCDKDVSDVGGGILTGTDISIKEFESINVSTENRLLEAVQSNNLADGYWLGTTQSENYGALNYGVLFRAEAPTSNAIAELNLNVDAVRTFKVKSANLIVPYAYTIENVVGGEVTLGIRDVINEGEPVDVDVFRNNFVLQLFSPDNNEIETYFSNASDDSRVFENRINIPENSIFEGVISNNPIANSFTINLEDENNMAISIEELSNNFETTNRFFQVALKKDFLGSDIVDSDGTIIDVKAIAEGAGFLEKFRGVYIQPKEGNTNMVRLFNNAFLNRSPMFNNAVAALVPKIELGIEVFSGENLESEISLTINLNRQIINITNFSPATPFNNMFSQSETIVLKGGASASEIKIFADEEEFESLYDDQIIVNQAILRFKVNQDSPLFIDSESLPETLFINQLETGNVLEDYSNSSDVLREHLLPFRTENGDLFYDIDVSEHVATILGQSEFSLAEEFNNKLAIGLSNQIDNVTSLMLRNENKRINIGNFQPIGEVPLYGSGANEDQRPRLLIKFTSTK